MDKHSDYPRRDQAKSSDNAVYEAIIIVGLIAITVIMLGLAAAGIFTTNQMYIIRPILAAIAVFAIFSYVLWFRIRASLFGEIGFIYLALILAYTILPAVKFLVMDFDFPLEFDTFNFAVLSPQPEAMGTHFWRHVLFMSGVAAGFLAVRGKLLPQRFWNEKSENGYGRIIAMMIMVIAACIFILSLLSAPVTTYGEHYIRFNHLSWTLRRVVYVCLILKTGGYFVLLSLMFSQYRKYRMLIFIVVPMICAYEIVSSFGSRILAFTNILAFLCFYHFRVKPISLKKAIIVMIVLASLFSAIGFIRPSINDLDYAQAQIKEKKIYAAEFESVYCTGFHLYYERTKGTLPPRDWRMFFFEIITVIPFIDHTTNHPLYWYARNYYPEAVVPKTTMGVIADSAIWGGEFDLLVRSLINGAIFALLTRWFLRRREKWWALTIYVYCYATCVLTLKHSLFYHIVPLAQIILPTLLLTVILCRLQKTPLFLKSFLTKPAA